MLYFRWLRSPWRWAGNILGNLKVRIYDQWGKRAPRKNSEISLWLETSKMTTPKGGAEIASAPVLKSMCSFTSQKSKMPFFYFAELPFYFPNVPFCFPELSFSFAEVPFFICFILIWLFNSSRKIYMSNYCARLSPGMLFSQLIVPYLSCSELLKEMIVVLPCFLLKLYIDQLVTSW